MVPPSSTPFSTRNHLERAQARPRRARVPSFRAPVGTPNRPGCLPRRRHSAPAGPAGGCPSSDDVYPSRPALQPTPAGAPSPSEAPPPPTGIESWHFPPRLHDRQRLRHRKPAVLPGAGRAQGPRILGARGARGKRRHRDLNHVTHSVSCHLRLANVSSSSCHRLPKYSPIGSRSLGNPAE